MITYIHLCTIVPLLLICVISYFFLLIFQSLGQVGRVSKVFPTGDVRVSVNGRSWTYNSQCLTLAPDESPPEIFGNFSALYFIFSHVYLLVKVQQTVLHSVLYIFYVLKFW